MRTLASMARHGRRGQATRILAPLVASAAAAVGATTLWASAAQAATLTVTTTDETSAIDCTLPAAITAANINADFDGCSAIGYGDDTIDISATGTINLTGSLPGITSNLEIEGPGASQLDIHRQDGSPAFGIFFVAAGSTVSISDLTISNGLFTSFANTGAGVRNLGTLTLDHVVVADNHLVVESNMDNGGPAPVGGGIANLATMTLRDSTVTGNSVSATNPGTTNPSADATGGGVMNFGTLTVERSTISGNEVTATVNDDDAGASAFAAGAGLRNWVTVTNGGVTVRRSTISGNTASASAPPTGNEAERGGGIYNFLGPLALTSTTLASNEAAQGANLSAQATETIANTIISDPVGGPNCDTSEVETDGGFNITFPSACPGMATALNADPMLGPLADNGGPTETRDLLQGSAALDNGTDGGDSTDQRGLTRPFDLAGIADADDGADIGALEAQDGDGDGVVDGSDACAALDGAGTASGCPAVTRELTLRYSERRERFKGRLRAPDAGACVEGIAVEVLRKVSGPDKVVGEATTNQEGRYSLAERARSGRYYARADVDVLADIAECGLARSAVLRVG